MPPKSQSKVLRQRCNESSGVLLIHLEFSASPSIMQPKETTWNPKDTATRGLETTAIQDLGMRIRVGNTADSRGCHENPLPILVLRAESQPQLPTVAPRRAASTDLAQLLPSPHCSHLSVNYPFMSRTAVLELFLRAGKA